MPEAGRRRALAVVTGTYRHAGLADLASPARDAEALERVLGDPRIGGFDSVETVLDGDNQTIRDRVHDFFVADARPDELLFAWFSGHGLRLRQENRLYLTTAATDPDRLPPTAIAADYVGEQLNASPAGQAILILDVCYAGAFSGELHSRTSRERVLVLTAGSTQVAHESAPGAPGPSAFAAAFFEGISSGRADTDANGLITIREAFDYAGAGLRRAGSGQTPEIRAGTKGDLVLCRSPIGPGRLTPEIDVLLRSTFPEARLIGVDQLAVWLRSPEAARVRSAEQALGELRRDSDDRVAEAAGRLLAAHRSPRVP